MNSRCFNFIFLLWEEETLEANVRGVAKAGDPVSSESLHAAGLSGAQIERLVGFHLHADESLILEGHEIWPSPLGGSKPFCEQRIPASSFCRISWTTECGNPDCLMVGHLD